MMTTLNRTEIRQQVEYVLNNKKTSDICFNYHKQQEQMAIMNKEEMTATMKMWKKQQKQNILTINPNNHREPNIFGTRHYSLTLQQLKSNGDYEDIGVDRVSLMGCDDYSFVVNGITFFFKKEENRDMVYRYVMSL